MNIKAKESAIVPSYGYHIYFTTSIAASCVHMHSLHMCKRKVDDATKTTISNVLLHEFSRLRAAPPLLLPFHLPTRNRSYATHTSRHWYTPRTMMRYIDVAAVGIARSQRVRTHTRHDT